MKRIRIENIMTLATIVADESEMPYTKVGCIITDYDGRILAGGSNTTGLETFNILKNSCNRQDFRQHVLHAEINTILSLPIGNRAALAFCTLLPCTSCLNALHKIGITCVYFKDEFIRDEMTYVVAEVKKVKLIKVEMSNS